MSGLNVGIVGPAEAQLTHLPVLNQFYGLLAVRSVTDVSRSVASRITEDPFNAEHETVSAAIVRGGDDRTVISDSSADFGIFAATVAHLPPERATA